MTKKELVDRLATRWHVTAIRARVMLDELFAELSRGIIQGKRLEVPDFGVFRVRTRKARAVVIPNTSDRVRIPRSRTVGFRAAKALKARL